MAKKKQGKKAIRSAEFAETPATSNPIGKKKREFLVELSSMLQSVALDQADGAGTACVETDKKTRSTRSFCMSYHGLPIGVLITVYRDTSDK